MTNNRITGYFHQPVNRISSSSTRFDFYNGDMTIEGANMSPNFKRVLGHDSQRPHRTPNFGTPEGCYLSYREIQNQICSVSNFLTTFHEIYLNSVDSGVRGRLDFILHSPSKDILAEFGNKYFEELLGKFTMSRLDVRKLVEDTFEDVLDQFNHDKTLIETNRDSYHDLAGDVFGLCAT